jgi:hypothetical protein
MYEDSNVSNLFYVRKKPYNKKRTISVLFVFVASLQTMSNKEKEDDEIGTDSNIIADAVMVQMIPH